VTNTQGAADQRGLQYFDITDFSPGIYDNSVIAFGATPTLIPGIFPAPPGAADALQTFGCNVEANGGLGPLPALGDAPGSTGLSLSDLGITTVGTTDISALVNSMQNSADELIIGLTDNVGGGFQRTRFWSYLVGASSLNLITGAGGTFNFATGAKNFVAYPFVTTMSPTQIAPAVILPLAAPDGPTSQLMNYPPRAAMSTFSVDTITNQPQGSSFGHQGRVVTIQMNNGYNWPVVLSQFPNEAFSYTDPPETQTWPHQFEIFGPENPYGYGAISSVSAGELFCVKKKGGAIIIQGDLNNPTVTTLPGVESTGIIYGHADTNQTGMFYCCQNRGAWVWNGGNSSTKISPQLDDNFFTAGSPISDTTYYSYYCQRWSQWMMFSNNWLYYTPTNSWWRLDDPSTRSFFWYIPSYNSQSMFAALASVPNDSTKFLFEYDLTVPRATYQWQSLPLSIAPRDRSSTVRELVLHASNAYADVAPSITPSLIDDKGNVTVLDTWNLTTGTNEVQTARLNAGEKQTTTVSIRLAVSGTNYAPVVHKLSLGYRSREHLGVT
jgi:hypothetical protein